MRVVKQPVVISQPPVAVLILVLIVLPLLPALLLPALLLLALLLPALLICLVLIVVSISAACRESGRGQDLGALDVKDHIDLVPTLKKHSHISVATLPEMLKEEIGKLSMNEVDAHTHATPV